MREVTILFLKPIQAVRILLAELHCTTLFNHKFRPALLIHVYVRPVLHTVELKSSILLGSTFVDGQLGSVVVWFGVVYV